MKTERRHELQENELAAWLGRQILRLKPYLRMVLGVVILIILAMTASTYLSNRNNDAERSAWGAYFDAVSSPDTSSFELVADSYPDTSAAGWALQSAGDFKLGRGIGQLFQNREQAAEELDGAGKLYQSVIDAYDDPMLLKRAMLGRAKTHESQRDLAAAQELYREIVQRWGADGDDPVVKTAQSRIDELESPDAQQWYDWFARQEPLQSPLDDPSFFQDIPKLPDQPDLSMPQPGQLLGGSETSDDAESSISTANGASSTTDVLPGLELESPDNSSSNNE